RETELLSLPGLAAASPEEVQTCIAGVAFVPAKARRLIQLGKDILAMGYDTVEQFLAPRRGTERVRENLLSLAVVGRETADAILLFASEHAVFVVDEYTRRIFRRLRAIPTVEDKFWDRPYEELRRLFERHIVPQLSLYDEYRLEPSIPRPVALLRDW